MNQEKVLLFSMSFTKEKKINDICRSLGMDAKRISNHLFGQKLGFLAGITGFKRENISYQEGEFRKEMVVFSGISSERLDQFLEAYRQTGLEPIRRKAVITPHNIFWSPAQLYRELEKEHQSFQKIQ